MKKKGNENMKRKEQIIDETMDDVILTTQQVRDYLLNEEIPFDERMEKLRLIKTAIEANKNIVSASVVKIHIERLKTK